MPAVSYATCVGLLSYDESTEAVRLYMYVERRLADEVCRQRGRERPIYKTHILEKSCDVNTL
jgi:hypothetical protein